MPHHLVPFDDAPLNWRAKRQLARVHSAQLSTNLAVFRHGLDAKAMAEMDAQDSQAIGDAARTALDEELGVLRDGLALAGQSAASVELVSRKVELIANINNRRITRRFGG
jgi:hypothetical protein